MTKHASRSPSNQILLRVLTGLGLVGACTVADKGDYTFTDEEAQGGDNQGGSSGSSSGTAGNTGGKAGKGGTSGEAGDGNGGTSGTAGDAGGGSGGAGGACDPNPCEHGDCTESGSSFTCDCDDGYQGVTCDDEIDECDPNPCLMGAACTDLVADFSCACPPQVTGKRCELQRFQPLGVGMPMTGAASAARAVSADGSAVLGHFSDTMTMGFARPCRWTFDSQGRPRPSPLPIPLSLRPDVNVIPYALSGDGEYWVGEVRSGSGTAAPSAIGGSVDMPGNFGTPPNAIASAIFDVNQDGTRSVGYFTDGMMNGVHAVRWDEQGMPLPFLNPYMGSSYYAAGAITRDGRITSGTARDTMNNLFLVHWVEPGATAPGTVRTDPGTQDLAVHGVSADGMTAVGTFWDSAFANFAFVTRSARLVNITPMSGTVPAASQAWDVSDDGQVIVGEASLGMGMAGGPSTAVVWKNDGTAMFRTLIDLLRENGAEPMGWNLSVAYGVSADGKVIVGQGIDPGGNSQGFIARLP